MPLPPSTSQRPRPATSKRRSSRRSVTLSAHRAPVALLVLAIVLLTAAGVWLANEPPHFASQVTRPVAELGATATAAPVIPPVAAARQAPPSPIVPAPTVPATSTASAPTECQERCLVRLPDPGGTLEATLGPRGLMPAYAADGWLWASSPAPLTEELRASGMPVVMVDSAADTFPLYAVRLPETGAGASLIGQLGTVVDRVDNQLIVAAATVPPMVDDLVAAGIAIEKVPPPATLTPLRATPGQLPPLTRAVPFRTELSAESLQATILDLQQAGDPAGDENSRYYTSDGSITAAAYLYGRMASYGLTVWYEDFVADTGALALNVVGALPGRDPSKTYLVIAHYDSFSADGGAAPGADDNASGVAAMLEIARILSGYDLAYPIRFAALTGEEAGLQGAKAFANQATADKQEYAGAFNLDALGNPGRGNQLIVNGDADSAWLLDLIDAVNTDYGAGQELLLRQNPAIVADDTILREFNGIPAALITRAVVGDNPLHHTADDLLAGTNVDSIVEAAYITLLALADLLSP